MIEGEDFSEPPVSDGSLLEMEKLEPLDPGQAEIYEKAFRAFHEARKNLADLLLAGGFGSRDIVRAQFQGENKHFITRPSKNGDPA